MIVYLVTYQEYNGYECDGVTTWRSIHKTLEGAEAEKNVLIKKYMDEYTNADITSDEALKRVMYMYEVDIMAVKVED